jgi:hypothetical protein
MYPPRNSPTAAERFQKSWCDPVSIPPSISLSNRREKPRCCRKQWQGRGEQVDYSEPTQPHFVVEADRHSLKLFTVLVGTSSKARKGASWGHVRRLFGCVDPEWKDDRILNGLSSGEGQEGRRIRGRRDRRWRIRQTSSCRGVRVLSRPQFHEEGRQHPVGGDPKCVGSGSLTDTDED